MIPFVDRHLCDLCMTCSENNSSNSDRVVTIDNGSQDDVWGQATSLIGQLGSVIVFNEAPKETHLTMLFNAGEQTNLLVVGEYGSLIEVTAG